MKKIHRALRAALFLLAFVACISAVCSPSGGGCEVYAQGNFSYGGYTYGIGDALGTYSIGKDRAGDLKAYEFAICGQEENGRILFLDGCGDMMDMADAGAMPWREEMKKIREVVVADDRITSIGAGAFNGCRGLEKAALGNGMEKIGILAFSDTVLQEIEIPEGVEEIGTEAFAYCVNLKDALIPGSVDRMGDRVFTDCISLERAVFQEGRLAAVPQGTFFGCTSLADVMLTDGMSEIGAGAFENCIGLSEIAFPEGMEKIGDGAFTSCIFLEQVALPQSLRLIGATAFDRCTELKSITIPSGVEEVREGAFSNCTSLTDIHAKGAGTQFQDSAFLVGDPYSAEKPLVTSLDTENQGLLNPNVWKSNNRSVNICTIRFVDHDGAELEKQYILKGKAFSVPEEDPEREADAQYSYVFTGWDPQLPDSLIAESDQTFQAQYRQEMRTYTIRFHGRDGAVISTEEAAYGQVPEAPQVPLEERDGGAAYAFSGWSYVCRDADGTEQMQAVWEMQPVSGEADYYAQYSAEALYEVSFLDWDGTEIARASYRQGEAVAVPQDPLRAASPQSDYQFSGWEPQVQAKCSGEASYRASYTETARTYTVCFLDADGTAVKEELLHYGDRINPPQAPEHGGMEFAGWNPEVPETVTGDINIKATYQEAASGNGGSQESNPENDPSNGGNNPGSNSSDGGNDTESNPSDGGNDSGNDTSGGSDPGNKPSGSNTGNESSPSNGSSSSGSGNSASNGETNSGSGTPGGNNPGNAPSGSSPDSESSPSSESSSPGSGDGASSGKTDSGSGTSGGSNPGNNSSGSKTGNKSNPSSGSSSPGSGADASGGDSRSSGGNDINGGNSQNGGTGTSGGNSQNGGANSSPGGNVSPSGRTNSSSGRNSSSSGENSGTSSRGNNGIPSGNNSPSGPGNRNSPGNGSGSGSTPSGNGKQDSSTATGPAAGNGSNTININAPGASGTVEGNGQKTGSGSTGTKNGGDEAGTSMSEKDNRNSGRTGTGKKAGEKTKDRTGKGSGSQGKSGTTEKDETGISGNGSKAKKNKGSGSKGNVSKTATDSKGKTAPDSKRKTATDGNAASGQETSQDSSINSWGRNTAYITGSGSGSIPAGVSIGQTPVQLPSRNSGSTAGNGTVTRTPGSLSIVAGQQAGKTASGDSAGGKQWKLTGMPGTGEDAAISGANTHNAGQESGQGSQAPFVTSLPADPPKSFVDAGSRPSTGGALTEREMTGEDGDEAAGEGRGSHSFPPAAAFLGAFLAASSCLVLASRARRKRKGSGEE